MALSDKREFDAKVVVQDDKTDIAILKIEGGDSRFPTIELRRQRHARSRRSRARHRQSVRRRPDRDAAASSRRWPAPRSANPTARSSSRPTPPSTPATPAARWSTCPARLVGINTMIFSQIRRLARHRLRHPLQPRAPLRRERRRRPQGRAAVARRPARTRHARDRRSSGARSHLRRRRLARHQPRTGARRPACRPATSSPASTASRSPIPAPCYYRLTTRGVGNTARIDVLRKRRPVTIDLALAAPPQPGKDDVRNLVGQASVRRRPRLQHSSRPRRRTRPRRRRRRRHRVRASAARSRSVSASSRAT